ncbi:MAG TPA: histone-like nucleoid-structuring protein Lsr2 [Streptomyces sp.]|nr:histone-like nucleoid-structuring protein Lsr2 [Streptomyces sp.]
MTIAALLRLLDEIDAQGGPDAARQGRLHLHDHQEAAPEMTQPAPQTPPAPEPGAPGIPAGQLLAWADAHTDPAVQAEAARARELLTSLRTRHAADQELAAITTEAEQLQKRLAQLQARQAELAPPKAKKRTSPSYPSAEIRAWAKEAGVSCPAVGRVPTAVIDAWRKATHPNP